MRPPQLGQRLLHHEAPFCESWCVWWIPPGNRVFSERSARGRQKLERVMQGEQHWACVRRLRPSTPAPAGPLSCVTWSPSDHQKAPLCWFESAPFVSAWPPKIRFEEGEKTRSLLRSLSKGEWKQWTEKTLTKAFKAAKLRFFVFRAVFRVSNIIQK